MADGAHTRQMTRQEMVQQLDEMRFLYEKLNYEQKQHCLQEIIASLESSWNSQIHIQEFNSSPSNTITVYPEPSKETMKNIEPETMKKYDPFIETLKDDSALQVQDSVPDVFMVYKVDSHVKEVEESPQQSTNSNDKNVAHQVFADMPLGVTSKEKQRKSLKAWKFKFKASFKRSKLMDAKLSFMEELGAQRGLNMEVSVSQFQVLLSSMEPSHRCHNHYEPLDVADKDMCDESVCDKDGDYILTESAKFCEIYDDPGLELMCLKQSHDSVENYLGSFEYALTRSSLQQTPSYQYRAPFSPYQSYNDQPLDTTRHNNLSNEMAASLGLVGGDDQEDDTKFARMKIVKKNNSETKIKFSSSNHPCFVALVSTSNLHKDTLSFPKDFTTSNGVKRECGGIVLTDKGDRAWALELRFNQVGNGKILVLSLCPAEKASKESFPVEVMHRINQMNAAGYSPNEKNVYTLTSGLCQVKRDHEAVRVLEKLMQSEFSLDLLDCSSLTCLFCEPKLGVEVTVLLNQMLLLGYHGLEMQVLSCLQEFGEGSKTDTHIVLCWKELASFLWFLHGKKLLDADQKMQSMLVSDFKTWVPHCGYELRLAGTDPVLGLFWSSFESDMNRLWRCPEDVLSFNSEMSYFLSEKYLVEFVGYKAHGRDLLVVGVKQFTLAATKFHLKHKWRSKFGSNKLTRTWTTYSRYDSSSCALRQEENYVLVLFIIIGALTLFNDQHTLVAEKNGTETSIVLKQIFGTHQDYYLRLFLERVKATFEIMLTVEHFENPLASILTYEVFHLQRPPESSTKSSSANILNFILEDKDVSKREVL